jgi:CIC family chloride channel protein
MRTPTEVLSGETTVRDALDQVRTSRIHSWLVVDERGVIGVINLLTLQQEKNEGADKKLRELVGVLHFPHVHTDQGLDLALERMGTNHLDLLPVVNRANVHKLEGVVTLADVLNSYGLNRLD